MTQLALRIDTPVQGELAGTEMGVLPNGAAFLSSRGVAHLCGVANSVIITATQEVVRGEQTPRAIALREKLSQVGANPDRPYEVIHGGSGGTTHAFSDIAVTAYLSYYAHTSRSPSDRAQRALAALATKGLRTLVYDALGLDSRTVVRSAYAERLLLNVMPDGFFSVFTEGAAFILRAEQSGLLISHETVPDISVGTAWSKWWVERDLDRKHGSRTRHPHVYPANYPQAAANGYIEPWVYPEAALADFRKWMRDHYVPTHFEKYLQGKVDRKQLTKSDAHKLLAAMVPRRLPKS